jgi:hypothetical protein
MKAAKWAETLLRAHPDGIALINDSYALQFANSHYLEMRTVRPDDCGRLRLWSRLPVC